MVATTSAYDLEILAADQTTWVGLMLARPLDQRGQVVPGAPVTVAEALTAADTDLPISKRLALSIQEDWFGGVGISYNEAPGVYTRTPGYAVPAGAATEITVTAVQNSASPIVATEQYGDSLWFAQQGTGTAFSGRVLRSVGGGATLTNSLNLGAGEYLRDLQNFDNGSGTNVLWASSSDNTNANGRLHRWNGSAWTSSAPGTFGTWGRGPMTRVWWVTKDGLGASRLVTISSGQNHISYTKPNSDPLLAASWVEGVPIGSSFNLNELVSSRRRVFAMSFDGLFDLDELGNSPNLTSYTAAMIHSANGRAGIYHDGYVYMSLGQGLDRVRVDEAGALQEIPGQCAPGWGTRAENRWSGYTTALAVDQGFLVDAIYSPSQGQSAIFWGKDRQTLGIETPNPLVWYGPEVVSATATVVTHLRVASPTVVPGLSSWVLWVAAWDVSQANPPTLHQISLPSAGSPLSDLLTNGSHRFATGSGTEIWQRECRLHLLPEPFGDTVSNKFLHQHGFATRGLDPATGIKLVLETRADAAPGSISWTTSNDVTVSPQQDVAPSNPVAGHRIERRISFLSPQGRATPAKVGVLDAVRTTAFKVVPDFSVRSLQVEYGAGVVNLDNVDDGSTDRSPDWISDQLTQLTRFGRTTLRDRADQRWTVVLSQVLDRVETLHDGPGGKSVLARLEVVVLAGPL
jgi:hypothetical protein